MIEPSVREMIVSKPQSAAVQFLDKHDHFHLWKSSCLHYSVDFGEFQKCGCRIYGLRRANGLGEAKRTKIRCFFLFRSRRIVREVNEMYCWSFMGSRGQLPSTKRHHDALRMMQGVVAAMFRAYRGKRVRQSRVQHRQERDHVSSVTHP